MALAAAILCICLQSQGEPSWLLFDAPKDVSKEDVQKAVRSLQARIDGYGFKDLKVTVESSAGEPVISVTSSVPMTKSVSLIVTKFATVPAAAVEVRALYQMSGAEQQQFRVPTFDQAADAAGPPGAKWFKTLNPQLEAVQTEVALLKRAFTLTRQDLELAKPANKRDFDESNHQHYKITDAGRKKMIAAGVIPDNPEGIYSSGILWLMIDGNALAMQYSETPVWETAKGKPAKWIRTQLYPRDDDKMMGTIALFIENPLPFALKARK